MKSPSQEYINMEKSKKRQPVELYHIYDGGNLDERFCSSDVVVSYGGNSWAPATITRSQLNFDSELSVSELTISTDYLNPAVSDYIASNPTKDVWVKCYKLFYDMSPYEIDVIFIGKISTVTISGTKVEAKIVGLEVYFNRPACVYRYQNQCNHTLFDEGCTLVYSDYAVSKTVSSVSSDGLTINVTSMSQSDGYYTLGYMSDVQDGETIYRMITSQVGTALSIRFKFPSNPSGTITIYPGCDGDIETCSSKFDNVANFLGFPYIPDENPTRSKVM